MNPQNVKRRSKHSNTRLAVFRYGMVGVLVGIGIVIFSSMFLQSSVQAPEHVYEEPKRELIDFHMKDLTHGWARYNTATLITEDGGATWKEVAKPEPTADAVHSTNPKASANPSLNPTLNPEAAGNPSLGYETSEDLAMLLTKPRTLHSITIESKSYEVKKSQFLTDRIGWVQLVNAEELEAPLWVTGDGGATWKPQLTADIQGVIASEQQQLKLMQAELAYYTEKSEALKAMRAEWTLIPDTASPGDIVLVRHSGPGDVAWQGKSYTLKPFGAGYFTYIPIAMDVKSDSYPIGNQLLTIQPKKFETQYLQVSKQLESMKQDTNRIQADQKKIDLARSVSQPEFLFTKPFLQPIEGRLTTPFGFTRYVNGKYDSSHRALDLAAKEGTPIKATNDGVVALADSLYLTGNSIYIDHGMSLFSQYAHLSELKVKAGDRVKQGDIIGLVGSTGFSTGPHLHFAFWAHNVPVNPNLFFDKTPFQWLKTTP
jgi:murein DD-endopeptidase MepM/ murein hydrolase activator NlpD